MCIFPFFYSFIELTVYSTGYVVISITAASALLCEKPMRHSMIASISNSGQDALSFDKEGLYAKAPHPYTWRRCAFL